MLSGVLLAAATESDSLRANEEPSAKVIQTVRTDRPFLVQLLPSPQDAEEARLERLDRERAIVANWWMVGLTVALAVIGAVQVIVAIVTLGGLKHAKAAAEAATASIDTLKSIERAYLVFNGMQQGVAVNSTIDGVRGNYYVHSTQVQNAGSTNALRAVVRSAVKVMPPGTKPDFSDQFVEPATPAVVTRGTIFNAAQLFVDLRDMHRAWRREVEVFVWTRAEYYDVFGPEPRFTEQVLQLTVGGDPGQWLQPNANLASLRVGIIGSEAN